MSIYRCLVLTWKKFCENFRTSRIKAHDKRFPENSDFHDSTE